MEEKFDFSGYATKNDLKCADGRTIRTDAFKDNDGTIVPLVWQHMHSEPTNVLGHALLKNREDGVYGFYKLNNSDMAQNAKELIRHGDISSLSIYANQLKQKGNDVIHGMIREVSLVLTGANPGAVIENVSFAHADGSESVVEDEAIIWAAEEKRFSFEDELKHEEELEGKTVGEIFDTLTTEQKNVVYAMLAHALEDDDESNEESDNASHSDKESEKDQIKHSDEGESVMKTNVFDKAKPEEKKAAITHDQFKAIMDDAQKCGSFREAFLAHAGTYGIDNIDYLFPDARTLSNMPELISRRMEWVTSVLSGTRHSPFSRIKSMAATLTAEAARAKGYIKGNLKKEEVIPLLKRTTTPTTIYKKQRLDRDDIIDITDLDVVAWLKAEMRIMLDEEIARAVLFGDGREIDDEDKINEDNIRPIAMDDTLYAHQVEVAANVVGDSLIEAILRARPNYKGSNPVCYTTEAILTDWLLLKDGIGRRLYTSVADIAAVLRVNKIITVEAMEAYPNIIAILVNLSDYTIGADKGGNVSMFDDFDIDYNQYKYLIETRISGCLTKPKSALVVKRAAGTLVVPTVPTFVPSTGVLTIPNVTGVLYYIDGVLAIAGAQEPIGAGEDVEVEALPDTGYSFAHNTDNDWDFLSTFAGTAVTPTVPTFVAITGVLTIPAKTGVVYKVDGSVVSAGAQAAAAGGTVLAVTAHPDATYYIPQGTVKAWSFTSTKP